MHSGSVETQFHVALKEELRTLWLLPVEVCPITMVVVRAGEEVPTGPKGFHLDQQF